MHDDDMAEALSLRAERDDLRSRLERAERERDEAVAQAASYSIALDGVWAIVPRHAHFGVGVVRAVEIAIAAAEERGAAWMLERAAIAAAEERGATWMRERAVATFDGVFWGDDDDPVLDPATVCAEARAREVT